MRILSEQQEKILNEERKVLNSLHTSLIHFGVSGEDQKTLAESIQQLDDLFLLVVVGEFNAGKSAFINALLGEKLLQGRRHPHHHPDQYPALRRQPSSARW